MRNPSIMQSSLAKTLTPARNSSMMQSSWASPKALTARTLNSAKESLRRTSSQTRPQTTGADSRTSILSRTRNAGGDLRASPTINKHPDMVIVPPIKHFKPTSGRHPDCMPDWWARGPSRSSRPQTATATEDSAQMSTMMRPPTATSNSIRPSITPRPQTTPAIGGSRPPSIDSRPSSMMMKSHTAAPVSRSPSIAMLRPNTVAADTRRPSTAMMRPQAGATESRSPSIAMMRTNTATMMGPQAGSTNLRAPSTMMRPSFAAGDPRQSSMTMKPRPHTAAADSRSSSKANSWIALTPRETGPDLLQGKGPSVYSTDPASTKRLQSVKSYTSPRFSLQGISPPGSPIPNPSIGFSPPDSPSAKQSVFDARDLKHEPFDKDAPRSVNGVLKKSRVRPNHFAFDPSLNLRSPSISGEFKVSTGPMDSLVTQMPVPPEPSDPTSSSTSPSEASRMLRRKHEAALRMYPRNTWGPITKWGYQEDFVPGQPSEKEHYLNGKDAIEKKRLEERRFGHKRHWVKFKNPTNLWEPHEERQSIGYIEEKHRFLTDSEKMLHDLNDKRVSRAKRIDEDHRAKKRWREFKRLERREGEYIDKRESDHRIREGPQVKNNDSGVLYNIVNLEYPNNYAGDLLRFEDAQISWRQCMRSLRIQSRQSGARFYNVVSWKPIKPCCVPPPKPEAPIPPDPDLSPSPRKPEQPLPRNMLHLPDICQDVPMGCTNDNRTNW